MVQLDATIDYQRRAENYLSENGGATAFIVPHLLKSIPSITSTSIVHDNASGPGTVTSVIMAQSKAANTKAPDIQVTDKDPAMLQYFQKVTEDEGWQDNVTAEIMDSQALSFADETFTHSISNFVIFALPDPVKATKDIHRTLQPSGTAILTSWRNSRVFKILQAARHSVRPDLPPFATALYQWEAPEKLPEVLTAGGFKAKNIQLTDFEVTAAWHNADALRDAFRTDLAELAKVGFTAEDRKKWDDAVWNILTDDERTNHHLKLIAWIAVAKKE